MSDRPDGGGEGGGRKAGLEVQIDEVTAQGVYSNGLMVYFNENEFILDFLYVQPSHPKARVRSRVIVTPRQARRLVQTLAEHVRRFEERFPPGGAVPRTPVH